jgi:hypothetical protein
MQALKLMAVVALLLGGVAVLLGGGCSSSSEPTGLVITNNVTNLAANATGNWSGTFTASGVPFSMTLIQEGSTLAGAYETQGVPGDVTGQINGTAIELTVTAHGGSGDVVSQWAGTINAELNAASGSFNIISGGGGSGAWQMSK